MGTPFCLCSFVFLYFPTNFNAAWARSVASFAKVSLEPTLALVKWDVQLSVSVEFFEAVFFVEFRCAVVDRLNN